MCGIRVSFLSPTSDIMLCMVLIVTCKRCVFFPSRAAFGGIFSWLLDGQDSFRWVSVDSADRKERERHQTTRDQRNRHFWSRSFRAPLTTYHTRGIFHNQDHQFNCIMRTWWISNQREKYSYNWSGWKFKFCNMISLFSTVKFWVAWIFNMQETGTIISTFLLIFGDPNKYLGFEHKFKIATCVLRVNLWFSCGFWNQIEDLHVLFGSGPNQIYHPWISPIVEFVLILQNRASPCQSLISMVKV